MVFDHWGGAAPASGGSITVAMDGDQLLIPFYVRQCFPVSVSGTTGGFASYTVAGLDCSGPQGAGAHRGDVVQARVSFGPDAFLDGYSLTGPDSGQKLSVVTVGEPQLPAILSWTVSAGGSLSFAVNRCFGLDLAAVPAGSAKVTASPAPNCPLPGITGYRGGTVVDVGASFPWPLEWTKWNLDGVSTTDSAFSFPALQPGSTGYGPSEDVTMDRDHTVRAIARNAGDCFTLSIGAADPGYGSASFTATPPVAGVGPYGDCPDGQYERGTTISGNASPHSADADWEVGWTYDGVPLDEGGNPVSLSGPFGLYPETSYTLPTGGIGFDDPTPHKLQAWFCPVLQVHSGGPGVPDGLYATSPVANNCPIDLDTWLPGTRLTLTAVAPKAAYSFQRWQGDGASGTTASVGYTVGSTSATSTVTAVFSVICHVLTTGDHYTSGANDSSDATFAPSPDCPNPGAPSGSYRADTIVIAQASDHGDYEPFLGWSGDSGDSTLLTAVGMNQDRSLIANYDDSASDPLGSPTNFGLYWSKAGKVVLGTITAALGNIVFGVVDTGFGGLSGVLDLLGKAGVPDAGTLAAVVNSSTQLLESSSSCVGEWGVGGSSTSSSTPVATTQGDALLIGKALKQLASDDLTPGPASVAITTATTAYSLGTPSINGDWSWSDFSDSMSRCTLQHLQQADQSYGRLFSQRLLPPATALGPPPDEDRQ
jgi:List-Bact-rpt repeat protein